MDFTSWTVDQVADRFLEENVEDEVILLFMEKEIDGSRLLSLSEEEALLELGVKSKNQRDGLLRIIQRLQSSSPLRICGAIKHDPAEDHDGLHIGLCTSHESLHELQYFCKSCDTFTCAECIGSLPHRKHEQVLIGDCIDTLKRELEHLVAKLGEQSTFIERVLKECGLALERLKQTTMLSIEEIKCSRDELVRIITDASEKAILEVKAFETTKQSYLMCKVEENIALKKEIDSLQTDLSGVLNECSPSLVLQRRDEFKAACLEVLGETKARKIVQLNATYAVQARVSESDLREFLTDMLYEVSENGTVKLSEALDMGSLNHASKIVAVGGYSGDFIGSAEIFDEASNAWLRLPDMLSKRSCYPAIGFSNNIVYVAGGIERTEHLASAEALDLSTLTWTALSPMNQKRSFFSGIFLADGKSFLVTGGFEGNCRLNSCEQLDTALGSWSEACPLPEPRSHHCTVLYQLKPVVLGGMSEADDLLNSCETLVVDSATNKYSWSSFPSFLLPRREFGAATSEGKIFIAGGYKDAVSIEVFDGAVWSEMTVQLASSREGCATVCLGPRLVVLGGWKDTVEVYEPFVEKDVSDEDVVTVVEPDVMAHDCTHHHNQYVSSNKLVVPSMKVSPTRWRLAAISF